MKEETKEKLTEKLISYVESTEEFLNEQCPAYITEILTFERIRTLVSIVAESVFIIKLATLIFICVKKSSLFTHYELSGEIISNIDLAAFLVGITSVGLIPILFTSVYDSVMTYIKLKVAPKLYIVEYLVSLKNKGK